LTKILFGISAFSLSILHHLSVKNTTRWRSHG
jgi:hypothetical protein